MNNTHIKYKRAYLVSILLLPILDKINNHSNINSLKNCSLIIFIINNSNRILAIHLNNI